MAYPAREFSLYLVGGPIRVQPTQMRANSGTNQARRSE
jgi:hypothetical protein